MAKFIHGLGIKVLYYISPQIWAWKKGRVHKVRKYVDRMFVILPFESAFYKKYEVEVDYVGHPLLDEIKQFRSDTNREKVVSNKKIMALLPGSRKQEIQSKLPIMAKMAKHYPDYELIVAKAPSMDQEVYTECLDGQNIRLVEGRTYDLLDVADVAIVTSGTATLETALFGVPEVVCYKGNPISYHIAKRIVDIKYISLVNLIMDKEVVKELIQGEMTASNIKEELDLIIGDEAYREQMLQNYAELKDLLGGSGASEKAALLMLKTIDS